MRHSPISREQGPAEILTLEAVVIAQAAGRYRAEADAAGADHRSGRLHRIQPADVLGPGTYRLRFDPGRQGDITIAAALPGSRVVQSEGVGDRPL